jgi:hypothetical protein
MHYTRVPGRWRILPTLWLSGTLIHCQKKCRV